MKTKSKVRQSTEKPMLNEMRKINGVVKIWDGKAWQIERGQFFEKECPTCDEHSPLSQR